ncbi:MAG TPA: hypothetical protein GXX28_12420, partial [Firmicutes bacterium]|nr:hypothetical protein [Bacillota bacterium]
MHYPKQLTRASKLLAVVVLLYVLLPLTMVVLLSFSTTMKIGAGDFTFRWYLMKMD